jgi:hypothetical protein|tara:strand:+ start:2307 stop:2552 length:246 start_codon:yes stop_codon:yes gene_type:complete
MTKSFCIVLIASALADDAQVPEDVVESLPVAQVDTAVVEAEQLANQMSDILARLKEIPTDGDTTSVPIQKVVASSDDEEKK